MIKQRNIVILISLLFGTGVLSYGQGLRFQVKYKGEVLTNNQIVEIRDYEVNMIEDMQMMFKVEVTNTSSDSYAMSMRKKEITMQKGTSTTVCWSECMPPYEFETVSYGNITPATPQTPYADFYLNLDNDENRTEPTLGTSIVQYTFKTDQLGDAKLTVEVHYIYEGQAPVAIQENRMPSLEMTTQNGVLLITTGESLSLPLYSTSGLLVRMIQLVPGINTVTGLQKGVYILSGHKIVL